MLTGIHVGRSVVEVCTIKNGSPSEELRELYRVTNCDCIDIAVRYVKGRPFDFVCDDEGLFKEKQFVSVLSKTHGVDIVGDVFICSHKGADLVSLTEDEIKFIKESVLPIWCGTQLTGQVVITD